MSLSTPFIERPVATTLLTIGVALAGIFAFNKLPVSPLPQVDFPTISVTAQMAGASPDTMAQTVATPLERYLGVIANVTEMTLVEARWDSTRITLQFDSQPRHRRRGARCPGGDQRGARRSVCRA